MSLEGFGDVATRERDDAQAVDGGRLVVIQAVGPRQCQHFLEARTGILDPTRFERDFPEQVQELGRNPVITRGPSQGESGGGIQLGIGKVQLTIGHPAGPDHGGGTHAGWSIGGGSQALSQPVPAFDKEGAPIPNPGCAVRKSQVSEDVSGFFEPGTRGPNVCKLAGQEYQPVTRSVRVAEFVSGPDQLADVPGVQFTRGLLVAG